MNQDLEQTLDPRIQQALVELQAIILRRYPAATFVVTAGDDPEGIYLKPIVDVDDTEEVFDTIAERLLELQIDEELPVYVIPVRPIERVAQMVRQQATASAIKLDSASAPP